MAFDRIGLIVNPSAGGGAAPRIARAAMSVLMPREVITGAGEMGMDALAGSGLQLRVLDWWPHAGRARTPLLSHRLAEEGVDAICVVGGDGTLADVAFALYQRRATVPLLGIGAGTANVGPLVTCPGAEIERLAGAHWTTREIDGLVVGVNDRALGLGFNDVVIGFTVLATQNGAMVDVDAVRKMDGLNIPRDPEPVWTERTRVVKVGPSGDARAASRTCIGQGKQVATVIAGFPDERFYGKAIAGGVLLSGLAGDLAGCLVCDHLLVRTQLDPEEHRRSEPVVSRYAGLNETERIEASGFREGTVLCADGNPLAVLREDDDAWIMVRRKLALSLILQVEEPRC